MLNPVSRIAALVVLLTAPSAALGQAENASVATGDTGIRSADPSVIKTDDGFVAVESRNGRALLVRVAQSLDALPELRPERIWFDRERLGEVWAPEIMFRHGRYEVYFTAGIGSDHRMYRIESSAPAEGYGDAVEILLPDDKWAIDGIPYSFNGADYFIWSGWQGDEDVQQDIFIARLNADGEVEAPRVAISSPDQPWENIAGETPTINEGPQPIVDPAGQLHIVYSANGSWGPNYCLADLRLRAGGDPLDPAAWSKSDGCLFGANEETLARGATLAQEAKGVGHHSFILRNGQDEQPGAHDELRPFLYHGVPAEEEPSNFWAARKWFFGLYRWAPDVAYISTGPTDTGWSPRFLDKVK
jgi:GH43 family beta-xylosidase